MFPNALALFSRQSPNHRGVLNSKVSYCLGDGIHPIEENDKATLELISKINYEKESLNDLQIKLYLDRFMTGNYWIELITDARRSFLWLNHLDATQCRLSKDQEFVMIHPNWSRYEGKGDKNLTKLPLYPNFVQDDKDDFSAMRCVYHGFDYEPEFTYYGLPRWIAGKDSVQIDLRTNKWNLGRLKNSFRPGATMVVPVADEEEGKEVTKNIKQHYAGEEKQGKTLIITKSRALESEKADQTQYIAHTTEDKGSWLLLHKQSLSDIIVAHSWYRALTGIADNTGFDTERILNEYYTALSTVITTEQKYFVQIYNKLFMNVVGQELPITFKNSPPLETDEWKYIWEARRDRGLPFDPDDPIQKELIRA